MKKVFLSLLLICCFITPIVSYELPKDIPPRPYSEKEICQYIAKQYHSSGIMEDLITEERLWDGSRIDLSNREYAIEVDFAPKWQEAIGQSLYYSLVSKKRPAIILIVKNKKEESRYLYRCQLVCSEYNIKLILEGDGVSKASAFKDGRLYINE